MSTPRIRAKAMVVFWRGDRILVNESHDSVKNETFFRPLGGSIEFGERGEDTARREIMEEIGAEIAEVRFLRTIESIYTFEGERGHDVVLLFEAEFADPSFYERDAIECELHKGEPIRASWKPLAFFRRGEAPLYPEGLLDILVAEHASE